MRVTSLSVQLYPQSHCETESLPRCEMLSERVLPLMGYWDKGGKQARAATAEKALLVSAPIMSHVIISSSSLCLSTSALAQRAKLKSQRFSIQ